LQYANTATMNSVEGVKLNGIDTKASNAVMLIHE